MKWFANAFLLCVVAFAQSRDYPVKPVPFTAVHVNEGTTEWAQFDFAKSSTVSESELYWFDDTGRGEVPVPASWRLLYKDGDQWKHVERASAYGVEKDRYNSVKFKPVITSAMRIEITMQPNWSAGIQRWKLK